MFYWSGNFNLENTMCCTSSSNAVSSRMFGPPCLRICGNSAELLAKCSTPKNIGTSLQRIYVVAGQKISPRTKFSVAFQAKFNSWKTRELTPATNNCSHSYSKNTWNLYVATLFGLCATLLRQRDFPPNGFIGSSEFNSVQNAMNCVILDSNTGLGGKDSNFGAHVVVDAQIAQDAEGTARSKANLKASDLELLKLKTRVSELKGEIAPLKSSSTSPSNDFSPGSSPVSSCSSSSSIEEIK